MAETAVQGRCLGIMSICGQSGTSCPSRSSCGRPPALLHMSWTIRGGRQSTRPPSELVKSLRGDPSKPTKKVSPEKEKVPLIWDLFSGTYRLNAETKNGSKKEELSVDSLFNFPE